ncbi:hypothetical protein E3N88_27942 [Mikania micrantha]|uniref:Uncharacterized protein n=1 Tax=Mikania micrantha TaxID=192012 RepID=A0A5N6MYN7_9ASTR|nr:hypothetical protein E3N88_27942 [Mikania micrantha]
MIRTSRVDKNGLRKGPWSKEEDDKLRAYIQKYGHWNWREIPRCVKMWKELQVAMDELSSWAKIAAELPGRSDNEIKNHWHTHLKKRAKNDQNKMQHMQYDTKNQTNFINDLMPSSDLEEVEALLVSSSSSSSSSSKLSVAINEYPYVTNSSPPPPLLSPTSLSSCSSSVEPTSSMFNATNGLISNDNLIQPYSDEFDDESFWTDPFFTDLDVVNMNVIMAPDDSDEFMWSTMDLYSQYHDSLFMI